MVSQPSPLLDPITNGHVLQLKTTSNPLEPITSSREMSLPETSFIFTSDIGALEPISKTGSSPGMEIKEKSVVETKNRTTKVRRIFFMTFIFFDSNLASPCRQINLK